MRTRAGWIALVLTGGLALAPLAVRAQGGLDIGREDPPIPLPIYSAHPEQGGFYVALEGLMYRQTRDFSSQRVAVRGVVDVDGSIQRDLGGTYIIPAPGAVPVFVPGAAGNPGSFLGSGIQALNVADLNGTRTYQPGWAWTFGWRAPDGSALEFRWRHVNDGTYQRGADIIPPAFAVGPLLTETFLTAPVYNFPNNFAGEPIEFGVGNPGAGYGIWNAASSMTIEFVQRYDQADLNYRVPVRTDEVSRTFINVGTRFAWIWERFKWRTVSISALGQAGAFDQAIYTNIISNRMYGPSLGCEQEFYLGTAGRIGAFSIGFKADFSPMVNIVKERASYELGDRSASTKRSLTEYTFVPMVSGDLQITWIPIAGLQVRLGWNSLAFMNTVAAPRPIAFNYGNLQMNNDFGFNTVAPAPDNRQIFERKALRYFDGIMFGAALSF